MSLGAYLTHPELPRVHLTNLPLEYYIDVPSSKISSPSTSPPSQLLILASFAQGHYGRTLHSPLVPPYLVELVNSSMALISGGRLEGVSSTSWLTPVSCLYRFTLFVSLTTSFRRDILPNLIGVHSYSDIWKRVRYAFSPLLLTLTLDPQCQRPHCTIRLRNDRLARSLLT